MPGSILPQDLKEFIEQLKRDIGGAFEPDQTIHIARAPARLDVMGGIADYSGSVVLEGVLRQATLVGVQKRRDRTVRVISPGIEREGSNPIAEFSLGILDKPASYEALRAAWRADPAKSWAAYVFGAFAVLCREGYLDRFPAGATIVIKSSIPVGSGVSSSAALEVASMQALCAAFGIRLPAIELARSCQIVENHLVGAPCGIMDQVTSAMGGEGKLLALLCQPHEVEGLIAIPPAIQFIGINSAVKHSVGGSAYTGTRVAAFMGRKIIFETAGGPRAHGHYLCNVTPRQWDTRYRAAIPERIKGSEFLDRHGSHDDTATVIEGDREYRPRSCTEHPILENSRTREFIKRIEQYAVHGEERDLVRAGELMYASHRSYSVNCGLGSPETDLIVDLVRQRGPASGLYGAKITGGGSGGTVAVLAASGTEDVIREIAALYQEEMKRTPDLFFGSSPGALELGVTEFVLSEQHGQ